MVTRTISFTNATNFAIFKNNEVFPASLRLTFDSLLEELRRLQKLGFADVDEENLTFTQNFIWESQEHIDSYLTWAEDNHNYSAFYAEWSNYINSLGGIITIDRSEI
jgi:hypothetical protein